MADLGQIGAKSAKKKGPSGNLCRSAQFF